MVSHLIPFWNLCWLPSCWISCSVQLRQHIRLLATLYHVSCEPGVLGWFIFTCSVFWLVLRIFSSQNTALSVLLVACSSADATLEAELKTSVLGVLSQFWSFLQAKQVREFAIPAEKAHLGEAGAVSSGCCYSFSNTSCYLDWSVSVKHSVPVLPICSQLVYLQGSHELWEV